MSQFPKPRMQWIGLSPDDPQNPEPDVGVVEGAAGAVKEAFSRWHRGEHDDVVLIEQDVMPVVAALVADREALLERIKVLESGSGTAACSGGDA